MSEPVPAVHAPPQKPRPEGRRDEPADGPPDLFAAVLAASAPPRPAPKAEKPTARTAHAEGDQAGRDSTSRTEKPAGDAAQAQPTAAPAPDAAAGTKRPQAAAVAGGVEPAGQQASATVAAGAATTGSATTGTAAAAPAAVPATAAAPITAGKGAGRRPTAHPIVAPAQRGAGRTAAAPATAAATSAATTPAATAETAASGEAAAAQAPVQAPGTASPQTAQQLANSAAHHVGQTPAGGTGGQGRHGRAKQEWTAQGGATAAAAAPASRRARPSAQAAEAQPSATTRTDRVVSPAPAQSEGAAPAPETGAAHAAASSGTRLRVHELAESMRAVVAVAQRRGTATARITLRPAELGGIQVRLRGGDGGVSAELTAESHVAAQALIQAGDDLRRSLQAQGVTLLGLDVRTAGDGAEAHGQAAGRGTDGRTAGGHEGTADGDEQEITIETSRLPDPGSQIDVLA